jgi:SAM-dependent methyltransferase
MGSPVHLWRTPFGDRSGRAPTQPSRPRQLIAQSADRLRQQCDHIDGSPRSDSPTDSPIGVKAIAAHSTAEPDRDFPFVAETGLVAALPLLLSASSKRNSDRRRHEAQRDRSFVVARAAVMLRMLERMEEISRYWDSQALAFDDEPDHGLRDPSVRAAWTSLLNGVLPPAPARVADLGCGTGTLSVLLAELGYDVSGLDLSPKMIEQAKEKARGVGVTVTFKRGDAAQPPWTSESFDVVLSRHVLWALPDIEKAVDTWTQLLNSDGRLVLIEGRWSTGAGLAASTLRALLRRRNRGATLKRLDDPSFWGGPIDDERYLIVSPELGWIS